MALQDSVLGFIFEVVKKRVPIGFKSLNTMLRSNSIQAVSFTFVWNPFNAQEPTVSLFFFQQSYSFNKLQGLERSSQLLQQRRGLL